MKTSREWFNLFLTGKELKELYNRTGSGELDTYHDNLFQALNSRFKYLYKPLSKKECDKWNKIIIKAKVKEKNINEKKSKNKLVDFVKSLNEQEKIKLKKC